MPGSSPSSPQTPQDIYMDLSSPVSEVHLGVNMDHAGTPRARPSLKRQSTAPTPYGDLAAKRARMPRSFGHQMWSQEVHSAFLEALHNLPPISTWHSTSQRGGHGVQNSGKDVLCRVVQEHIYNQTGETHSMDYIAEQVDNMFIAHEDIHEDLLRSLDKKDSQSTLVSATSEEVNEGDQIPSMTITHIPEESGRENFSGSISSRRSATNRNVPNLRVNIPPSTMDNYNVLKDEASLSMTPGSAQVSSASAATAFLSFVKRKNHLSRSNTPVTPLDQLIRSPLDPPPTPRTISMHRNGLGGRWLPTPTEGVLPVLSPIISSPTHGSEYFADDHIGTAKPLELRAGNRRRRATIAERQLSGLSSRSLVDGCNAHQPISLGSPFGVDSPSLTNRNLGNP